MDKNKSKWHIILFSTLWAYRTSVKMTTGFTLFQLVYGLEAIFPIECENPSLKFVVQLFLETFALEARLMELKQLDETRNDVATVNEAHRHHVKIQYDKFVCPRDKKTWFWYMIKQEIL